MGQSNPWGVCHTWQKGPFLTILWTHFESFVCNATDSDFNFFASYMSVYVFGVCVFSYLIFQQMVKC